MMNGERIARFVTSLKDDPRVLGIARERASDRVDVRLCVIVTWDGGESLPAELPRLCAPLVGDEVVAQRIGAGRSEMPATTWEALGDDGTRAEVILLRAQDVVPDSLRAD